MSWPLCCNSVAYPYKKPENPLLIFQEMGSGSDSSVKYLTYHLTWLVFQMPNYSRWSVISGVWTAMLRETTRNSNEELMFFRFPFWAPGKCDDLVNFFIWVRGQPLMIWGWGQRKSRKKFGGPSPGKNKFWEALSRKIIWQWFPGKKLIRFENFLHPPDH